MNLRGVRYRAHQFWAAWHARPTRRAIAQGREILNPEQMALFSQMQPSDQAHSLAVMAQIKTSPDGVAETYLHDLLVASLLHDVGKSRYPLSIWERAIIVVSEAMFPSQVERLGAASPDGWRKAFVIAKMHPEWGASMAAEASTTPLAIQLIREHQNPIPPPAHSLSGPWE